MSRVERFRIKNAMIIANLISNVIGVAVVNLLTRISPSAVSEELLQLMERTTWWFIPSSMLLPLTLSLIYERPIRKYFQELFRGRTSAPEAALAVRRRLLNEPFFLILVDFSMWIAASDCLFDGSREGGCRSRSDPEHPGPKPSHRTNYCHRRFLRPGVRAPRRLVPHVFPTGDFM